MASPQEGAAHHFAVAPQSRSRRRPKLPHLVVLLSLVGVAQHLIRLRDLLEALGGLGIVLVFVRMMLRGELAVLLLDFFLRRRGRNAHHRVVILRLSHIDQYVLSRSIASQRRALASAVVR